MRTEQLRVLRGGSWINVDPTGVCAADRSWGEAAIRNDFIGFRCALVVC